MELTKGGSRMGYLSFFCLHWITCLSIYSHTCLIFLIAQNLPFCFLFVCMVDQTEMCPSSISPLGLLQRIKCNTERLKGTLAWRPELLGGPKSYRGPDLKGGHQTPLYTIAELKGGTPISFSTFRVFECKIKTLFN